MPSPTAPGTRRRTRRSPDALRTQILEAASELFLRDGYASTSIDAVIEKVGGSKRAIYSYFGGKEELFAAIMTSLSEQALQALPDARENTETDVRAALMRFADAVMQVLMDPRTVALYRLAIAEGARMPELAGTFLRNGPGRSAAGLAQLLKRYAEAGLLAIPDPLQAAEHFIGMLRDDSHLQVALGLRRPLTRREWEPRVALAVDIFLYGTSSGTPKTARRRAPPR